jgi:putative nucleotidyltransferase with HDIG domain
MRRIRFLRFRVKRRRDMRKQILFVTADETMSRFDPNTIFHDITYHLITDEKPSHYIEELDRSYGKEYPFSLLHKLKETEQSPKYHPEGSAWNHTMMVLDEAARVREKSRYQEAFMWSALLHDIGKPSTTRNRKGRITSYDHDKEGEELCKEFLRFFDCEEAFVERVAAMVRYHMHMLYVLRKLPYADMKGLLRRVDVDELALLCLCDRLGRTGADFEQEEKEYYDFLKALHSLTV